VSRVTDETAKIVLCWQHVYVLSEGLLSDPEDKLSSPNALHYLLKRDNISLHFKIFVQAYIKHFFAIHCHHKSLNILQVREQIDGERYTVGVV